MIGSAALQKLLTYQSDGDLRLKRGYHTTTGFDHVGVGSSCSMEFPGAVLPPSGTMLHTTYATGCFLACALSRARHAERWWLTGVMLGTGYYAAAKFHYHGNGAQGHAAGVWCAAFAIIGYSARIMARSGRRSVNVAAMGVFAFQGWYDWGRSHMWTHYIAEFKKDQAVTRGALQMSLWAEYIPSHMEPEFVSFRKLHELPEAADDQ